MAWTAPKTDWTGSTRNNSEDFTRQCDNIEHIAMEILPSLYYHPEYTPVPAGEMPTYGRYNTVEGNLQAIAASGITLPPGWEAAKTWTPGAAAPDYNDANRWERNVLLMYQQAQRIAARWRVSGTFAAGQDSILPRRI